MMGLFDIEEIQTEWEYGLRTVGMEKPTEWGDESDLPWFREVVARHPSQELVRRRVASAWEPLTENGSER